MLTNVRRIMIKIRLDGRGLLVMRLITCDVMWMPLQHVSLESLKAKVRVLWCEGCWMSSIVKAFEGYAWRFQDACATPKQLSHYIYNIILSWRSSTFLFCRTRNLCITTTSLSFHSKPLLPFPTYHTREIPCTPSHILQSPYFLLFSPNYET